MKNNSQATNEVKFKIGQEVYFKLPYATGMFINLRKFIVKGNAQADEGANGYWLEGEYYQYYENELLTKEQALLAFQEWLGKE